MSLLLRPRWWQLRQFGEDGLRSGPLDGPVETGWVTDCGHQLAIPTQRKREQQDVKPAYSGLLIFPLHSLPLGRVQSTKVILGEGPIRSELQELLEWLTLQRNTCNTTNTHKLKGELRCNTQLTSPKTPTCIRLSASSTLQQKKRRPTIRDKNKRMETIHDTEN